MSIDGTFVKDEGHSPIFTAAAPTHSRYQSSSGSAATTVSVASIALSPSALSVGKFAFDVALRLAFSDIAPPVVELLAAREAELDLGAALVADVQAQRHDRQALGRGTAHELVDLRAMKQQLAVAARLVVVAVALLERRDVRAEQPRFALLDAGVGIGQVDLARTRRSPLLARSSPLGAYRHSGPMPVTVAE